MERMERPPRNPHRISKRVLVKWEKLVDKALVRASYNRDGRGRGSNSGHRGERAPQSLAQQADIDAVLQAADEIGHENLAVARILAEHAYRLTQQLDPKSEGRGVLQFKTGLQSIIKQKQQARQQGDVVDRSQDIRIIQNYYKRFREREQIDLLEEEARNRRPEFSTDLRAESQTQNQSFDKLRRVYEISRILNDVVDALLKLAEPEDASRLQDTDEKRVMEEDAKKLKGFKAYNILPLKTPLEAPTVLNPFDYFPEVVGATQVLRYTQDLPRFPSDYEVPEDRFLDVFDFLHYAFGFQKDNVANQREHIVLLLASAQSRVGPLEQGRDIDGNKVFASEPRSKTLLNPDKAVSNVHDRILENYGRWCHFLRREPQYKRAFTQQRRLILAALYLLVWGEAANLRFMPECLCYIFHHLADECIDLLGRTYVERSKTVNAEFIEFSFLEQIVTPVYDVVAAEAKSSQGGKVPHSRWRNYDDFNEYFWQPNCFVELGWPWRKDAGFFKPPKLKSAKKAPVPQNETNLSEVTGRRSKHKVGKVHFVEHRTGFHIYHSFHRLWIFLVCMLQGLTIWAFCSEDGKLNLHVRTIKRIMSVGPTFVVMKFVQSVFDIVFMWGAFKATRLQTVARMLLRFLWFTCLSAAVLFLYIKTLEEDARNDGSGSWFRIYYILISSYAGANAFFVFLLRIPFLQRQAAKCSNVYLFQFVKWLHQERYYVGRSMYERTRNYIKYSLFWIVILICKFAFTMHFQIMPLVVPTRLIIGFNNIKYKWPDFVSDSNHNALTIAAIWAPVVMIYFLDTQVWYTVISAFLGGIEGARDKLGEIRTLEMLRKRFPNYPAAYVKHMQPPINRYSPASPSHHSTSNLMKAKPKKLDAIRFQPIWNMVIKSLREEDLLNNREKVLLKMPPNLMFHSNGMPNDLIHWPLFLLANKVHIAVELAVEHKTDQFSLWEKVRHDDYMAYAVQETFETLEPLLLSVLNPAGRKWLITLFGVIKSTLFERTDFRYQFNVNKLRDVLEKLRDLTEHLGNDDVPERRQKATLSFFHLFDVVMRDFLVGEESRRVFEESEEFQHDRASGVLFTDLMWPNKAGRKQAKRLNNLLTVQKIKDQEGKTKTLNTETIPHNLEARRRLQFFTNSLFMHMPEAPPIRKMFSFCVFTPYYEEDVMYDMEKLSQENEDGITILFYLQKIYPDEWQNFLERIGLIENIVFREIENRKSERHEAVKLELRLWASYRGQTLARTVRGMMYYKAALEVQGMQEGASGGDLEEGIPPSLVEAQGSIDRSAVAQAELKFTYVVTCQIYGEQKRRGKVQAADILYLMNKYDSLRIAYIDVVESSKKGSKPSYYSKLCKVAKSESAKDNKSNQAEEDKSDQPHMKLYQPPRIERDQEVYSIKLPGEVRLGEGKPENQNHAIVFTRGDCIQTIDMNQDNFMEEAFKMRNLLEEFKQKHHGLHMPTILGVREHVFTGSVSSLAWFMSMQESSFVTLGQRVLARPLKVRMHYGHPDVFDRVFHITRGGISKASRVINLSEDIFAGFNTTLRLGNVTHHEYVQVGKGRDVGLNQIALFEAKVASGNGEQTLSRDVYRLGQLLDFPRMLSFFFTSIGFYVTTMMTVLTLYVFLYGKAYLALSGVDASLKTNSEILQNPSLETALNTQFLFQIGIFTAVPMIVNLILEQGILKRPVLIVSMMSLGGGIQAIISFCTMQLQLASVFFTFSLGTRTHYFGRTILHGGAKYRSTGRGFVVTHIQFAENYRLYSRSHFTKALEIIMLLIIYLAYGAQNRTSVTFILLTFSSWFLALSWLFAPYIFNPSGFEWQKTVEDFDDWTDWMFYKGGVGVKTENSWEAWWFDEQDHIRSLRGRFWEVVLSLRFFLFQYGVVYSLSVTKGSSSILVYAYSWFVLLGLVIIFKVFTVSQKASTNFQLAVRLFQGLLFACLIAGLVVSVVLSPLTIGDVFALALALIPTGWGLLSIAIAFRPLMERMRVWKSIREIARVYDACMGMIIFIPIAFLSWFPFISTFQTRLVFNQAFSRGLEISLILSGNRPNRNA